MKNKWIKILSILLLLASTANAAMVDVCRSCVRVSTEEGIGQKSYGSGGIVGADEESYIVVTCEHVAHRDNAIIEIVRFGMPVKTVRGKVVGRDSDSDCAFIRIAKKDLGDVQPGLLPIDAAYELKKGDTLWGASFPEGGSLTVFEMEYIGIEEGWIKARPSIKQGRSGGIVVDADGTRVIGITWGTNQEYCYIVPAKRFAKAVGKELTGWNEKTASLNFDIADKALFNRFKPQIRPKNKPNRRLGRPKRAVPVPQDEPLPNDKRIQPSGKEMHSIIECQYCPTCPNGQCPNGLCPDMAETVTRPAKNDVKPKNPLPVATTKKAETLPSPVTTDDIIAPVSVRTPEPIPVQTVNDPRIDEIKQTLFGLSNTQSGIDKKIDQTLDKVSDLVDDKKATIEESVTKFRTETLAELDKRTDKITADIDQRIQAVNDKLATLEETNAQIGELKQSIDNFSIVPKNINWGVVVLFGVLLFGFFYLYVAYKWSHR